MIDTELITRLTSFLIDSLKFIENLNPSQKALSRLMQLNTNMMNGDFNKRYLHDHIKDFSLRLFILASGSAELDDEVRDAMFCLSSELVKSL
jgi:hypothetical protein